MNVYIHDTVTLSTVLCGSWINVHITLSVSAELRKCGVISMSAMKAYGGREGIAPFILNVSTGSDLSVSRPGHFNPRKGSPGYLINTRRIGLQRRS